MCVHSKYRAQHALSVAKGRKKQIQHYKKKEEEISINSHTKRVLNARNENDLLNVLE